MGRSRDGLTTKIHAVVIVRSARVPRDAGGLPRFTLSPGQHEARPLAYEDFLPTLPPRRQYDAEWIRTMIEEQDAVAIIPDRSNAKAAHAFSHILYRLRNRVERFFNKLKQFRRIATRYEKLAANYLAMIKLATIRIWLGRVPGRGVGVLAASGSCG